MRLKTILHSKRLAQIVAGFFLTVLAGYGVYASTAKPQPAPTTAQPPVVTYTGPGVQSQIAISQTKVLQGSNGEVYLKLTLTPDAALTQTHHERKPTDFVVVLDRSGSMADKNKMEYAHKAIESLLQQMNEQDRFTLVTFDSIVETPIRLQTVGKGNRAELVTKVLAVNPRGGTNLADGLLEGARFLKVATGETNRAKRLILISDGQANIGVTDPATIGNMAKNAASGEFAISTIGVGLDYNEQLLANVADYGMGNYHYLEKLGDMDKVLAGEFTGASQVVVQNLAITLHGAAAELIDASGYPIEKVGGHFVVKPGHLYAGQDKIVYLTFQVPTQKLGEFSLGAADLSYQIQDKSGFLSLMNKNFTIACLPMDKKNEVLGSIDKGVYGEVWETNNYGRFLKSNSQDLSQGNSQGFLDKLGGYKQKLEEALTIAPSEGLQKQYDALDQMSGTVSSSAASPEATKSLGKKYHSDGIGAQRKSK